MEDLVAAAAALHVPGFDPDAEQAHGSSNGDPNSFDLRSMVADTSLVVMAGGMSNAMYRLERSNGSKIVTRVVAAEIPPGSNELDQDLLMRALAERGITAASYGIQQTRHGVVRFEQFIEGATMTISEYREQPTAGKLGAIMGLLHTVTPSQDLPVKLQLQSRNTPSMLVGRLATYASAMGRAKCTPPDLEINYIQEASWLISVLHAAAGDVAGVLPLHTVLTHGDNQPGNWLLSGLGSQGLTLIDWEYACFAPFPSGVGFDLGNAMCEHTFDYSVPDFPGFGHASTGPQGYPPVDWQRAYIGGWASTVGGVRKDETEPTTAPVTTTASDEERTSIAPELLARHFPESHLRAAALVGRLGILNSHLFWVMWSFLMASGRKNKALQRTAEKMAAAASSETDKETPMPSPDAASASGSTLPQSGHSSFGYEEYGRVRWAEYLRLKAAVPRDDPALVARAEALAKIEGNGLREGLHEAARMAGQYVRDRAASSEQAAGSS